jgi:hypothetical protein
VEQSPSSARKGERALSHSHDLTASNSTRFQLPLLCHLRDPQQPSTSAEQVVETGVIPSQACKTRPAHANSECTNVAILLLRYNLSAGVHWLCLDL